MLPNIFAIGDLAGPPMLAHNATHEAKVAAEVAAGHKAAFDARCIPSVAYTDPEIAWVGVNETEAKERGIEYARVRFLGPPAAVLSPSIATKGSPSCCSTSRRVASSAAGSSAPMPAN